MKEESISGTEVSIFKFCLKTLWCIYILTGVCALFTLIPSVSIRFIFLNSYFLTSFAFLQWAFQLGPLFWCPSPSPYQIQLFQANLKPFICMWFTLIIRAFLPSQNNDFNYWFNFGSQLCIYLTEKKRFQSVFFSFATSPYFLFLCPKLLLPKYLSFCKAEWTQL